MILLSSFPRVTRQTLAAGAICLGVLGAGLFQPPAPPVASSAPPATVQPQFNDQQVQANVEEFGGIGLYVGSDMAHDGRFTALEPLPGYPAERAGVQPNDVIETVDGVSTENQPAEDVVTRLRGDVGTQVEVGIYRPSTDERFSLSIERELVRCERCPR